ncbi:hypothetical protein ABIC08_009225 [Bradyrhizobium sp. RT9b]|uniref:hypothetical protein n=1 Tax=Bradyrhizobium sp. RT9b TaxID=3156385 RepID=UPI003390EBCD
MLNAMLRAERASCWFPAKRILDEHSAIEKLRVTIKRLADLTGVTISRTVELHLAIEQNTAYSIRLLQTRGSLRYKSSDVRQPAEGCRAYKPLLASELTEAWM